MLLVGWQEGHPACKKYVEMNGRCVCLPLSIFPCTIKSRSSLLALAHPGGPGKRAVKRLWCGGGVTCYKDFTAYYITVNIFVEYAPTCIVCC